MAHPDPYAATVLRTLLAHAPCTKLCVKQHSGLSMSTVLRALDELCAKGWASQTTNAPPRGGKPHARLTLGTRTVYGAERRPSGWRVCALSLAGQATFLDLPTLDGLQPLEVAGEDAATAQGAACYLALHGGGVWLEDGRLYRAEGEPLDLAGLPSPLWQGRRLDYREAYLVADEIQRIRLTAERALWTNRFWGEDRICTAADVALEPAQMAAWERIYALLKGYL